MCGRESVVEERLTLALFGDDLLDVSDEGCWSDEVAQRYLWMGRLDELGEVSAGLGKPSDIAARRGLTNGVDGLLDVVSQQMVPRRASRAATCSATE